MFLSVLVLAVMLSRCFVGMAIAMGPIDKFPRFCTFSKENTTTNIYFLLFKLQREISRSLVNFTQSKKETQRPTTLLVHLKKRVKSFFMPSINLLKEKRCSQHFTSSPQRGEEPNDSFFHCGKVPSEGSRQPSSSGQNGPEKQELVTGEDISATAHTLDIGAETFASSQMKQSSHVCHLK